MDKLIAVEEMQFDSVIESTANQEVDFEIDPDKYRKYLTVNPIWNFLSLSRDEYFNLSIGDRKNHIEKYYKHMLNGKNHFLELFLLIIYLGLVRLSLSIIFRLSYIKFYFF